MKNLYEHLFLLRSPGVGAVTYANTLNQFNGDVFAALDVLKPSPELRDSVQREMDAAAKLNIEYISDDDEHYPAILRLTKNHPPIITARGNIETLSRPAVSIVGTRHATAVGMNFIADIAQAFVEHDIVVVSGMAIGTDSAAHIGALRPNGKSNTIAVLAGGVDYIWPIENESLYYEILERGAVVSDMPVGFIPKGTNFVQRNRIIAGLGEKLILSEADLKSGSMKTANFAIQYGRKVYAIPSHPADSRGAGPNSLIRSGAAILCQGTEDFFADSKIHDESKKNIGSDNSILEKLGTVPLSESVLAEIVGKSISEIKRELVILELQGLVQKCDTGYIRL